MTQTLEIHGRKEKAPDNNKRRRTVEVEVCM
jgi:hypothetical protein